MLLVFTVSVLFYPVILREPYEVKEQFIENYTVVEPREVRVSDWIRQNITVNQSFMDTRYRYEDLIHEVSMISCIDHISFMQEDLSDPSWGRINLMPYGNEVYFAGYRKGSIVKKDTNTFNLTSRTGHVYKILRNERINAVLGEGEYLGLTGYDVQVNKIGGLKSSSTICESGHYIPDDEEGSRCTTTISEYSGALLSLSDLNIVKSFDARNGSTLIYEKTLSGGETIPALLLHVKEVNDTNVVIDAVFQISSDYADLGEFGNAEIDISIKNLDLFAGTFELYQGFILNSSLGIESGKMEQVFLNPDESRMIVYTISSDIESCRYFSRSITKKPILEKFANYHDVEAYKKHTIYRNVTLYVDVVKNRTSERNVIQYRNKTVFLVKKLYRDLTK